MRLRWLLPWLVVCIPSIASARMPIVRLEPTITIGAAASPDLDSVVIAFYNRTDEPIVTAFNDVTIIMSSETQMRSQLVRREVDTIHPHRSHFETVDLAPLRKGLAPGDYTITVTWRDQITATSFTIEPAPDFIPETPSPPPSKWPYVLAGLGLVALLRLRAGTDDKRMPCSLL